MVRTKADAATRVAAGGKAPKKTAGRPVNIPSPNANDKGGKDHLPGNRACPRETPAWQRKITSFYDRNAQSSNSTENSGESSSSNSKKNSKPENDSVTDESSKHTDDGDNVEMEEENSNVLESSKIDESESMETDE